MTSSSPPSSRFFRFFLCASDAPLGFMRQRWLSRNSSLRANGFRSHFPTSTSKGKLNGDKQGVLETKHYTLEHTQRESSQSAKRGEFWHSLELRWEALRKIGDFRCVLATEPLQPI